MRLEENGKKKYFTRRKNMKKRSLKDCLPIQMVHFEFDSDHAKERVIKTDLAMGQTNP